MNIASWVAINSAIHHAKVAREIADRESKMIEAELSRQRRARIKAEKERAAVRTQQQKKAEEERINKVCESLAKELSEGLGTTEDTLLYEQVELTSMCAKIAEGLTTELEGAW